MQSKFAWTAAFVLASLLLVGPIVAHGSEQDFDDDDDGIVEEVQDDVGFEGNNIEINYESPEYDPEDFHFVDHFDDIEESRKRWTKSEAKKDDIDEEIAKYDGVWSWEAPQRIVSPHDIGLVLKSKAKHAAIAARLRKQFVFEDKPLIVQYEVTMQEGQDCGGSYIKLLSASKHTEDLKKFNDKTPYTIMFGPDKCGNDHKMHFIFRHVNPINGSIAEKHCRKPKERIEEPFKDKLPHLYQLIVHPDNTFQISLDNKVINEGSLLTEFTPPVNPPREIDDPEDVKPDDWDEREKIPDTTVQKPDDWDDDAPAKIPDPNAEMPDNWLENEPGIIPDPSAFKPDDWDTEIDGEWEAPLVDNPVCEKAAGCGEWKAPLIDNPDYKGKWRAPMIDNPNYKGKWAPKKIPNPDYYEDLTPFKMTPISAVGIELWSMSSDILFDNLIITDDILVAKDFAAKTFDLKRRHIAKESESVWSKVYEFINASPWSWKLGIVLVITPLAFSLYRLCSKRAPEDSAAEAKKTDAEQEDDAELKDDGDNVNNAVRSTPSPKRKKTDLNVKQDVNAAGGHVETIERESNNDDDDNDDDNDNEEVPKLVNANETEEESSPKPNTARKRRPRKDES